MQLTTQLLIERPRDQVIELYTCREKIPLWWTNLISSERISGEHGAIGSVYEQKYMAMGKYVEERVILIEIDWPRYFHTRAESPVLSRDSRTYIEVVDDRTTRITVNNHFQGEYVPSLVTEDLQKYTLQFLQTFKDYALTQD